MGIAIEAITRYDGKSGAVLAAAEDRVGATAGGAAYFHLRVTLLTDAQGAAELEVSGLTLSAAGNRRLRMDVTADDAAHVYGGSGGVPLETDGTGRIEAKLRPGTRYYLWLYCDGACDLFHSSGLRLLPWGSYGTPALPLSPGGFFGAPVPISLRVHAIFQP